MKLIQNPRKELLVFRDAKNSKVGSSAHKTYFGLWPSLTHLFHLLSRAPVLIFCFRYNTYLALPCSFLIAIFDCDLRAAYKS